MKKLPVIKNRLHKDEIDKIPSNLDDRREFLKKRLEYYNGRKVFCPALGVNVFINAKGIIETAENSAVSKKSIVAALNVVELLKHSVFYKGDMPRSNSQKRKFDFVFIYVLKAKIEGFGIAKTVVGARVDPDIAFLEYSATIPEE